IPRKGCIHMSGRSRSVPSYRRHKSSGPVVITLPMDSGRRHDVLLGKYGSRESRIEYARVIAEWEAAGRRAMATTTPGSDLSVAELVLAFWKFADQHYRHPDGRPNSEINDFRLSLRPLKELYGRTQATAFGPLALRAVRQKMVDSGLCRKVVNARV